MKIKKILSLLLAVIMVVGLVPSTVLAAEGGVAEVGGATYATLLDAVNAAEAGDTITMLADYTVETAQYTAYEMPEGSTLDLNGKTLTIPFATAMFAGKDFTITNGTITPPADTNTDYALFIGNTVNADEARIETSATIKDVIIAKGGINVRHDAEATIENADVTVNPNRKYYAVYAEIGSTVNIMSGIYTGGRNGTDVYVAAEATVNITGGIFNKKLAAATGGTINITGGTFANKPDDNYIAAGSTVVDNSDGTFTVIPPGYVAEIGDSKYVTLLEAVSAAQAGETIKLLDDCTLATGVQDQVITLPDNAILDLNGKTLTIPFRDAWFAGNNITIENGTLTTGGLENYVLYINGGSFTVKDVTTTNGINVQTGKATLENVDVTNPNKYYAVYAGANTEVSILSGTFKKVRTDKPIILYADAGATVDISGGTFELNLYAVDTATIAVSGGIFANPVEPGHCAEGYEPVDNGDGTYGVKTINYVAEVGGVKYATLLEAVGAATDGQTITLLTDYTVETVEMTIYAMPDGSTLDLNDKVLKIPHTAAFFTGNNITIQNGDIIKTAEYADYALFIGNDSSVTIKDIESNAGINIQNNSKATLDNVVAQNFYKYYAVYAGENSEVTILSGYFDGGSKNKDLYGGITVYGGSYEHDPSAFVAEGYRAEEVNGRYEIVAIDYAAEVGGVKYETLIDAVNAAQAGETITLLRDYTIETAEMTTYAMPDGSTLDLNDKVLKIPHTAAFFTGNNITIQNGDVIKTAEYADYALFIGNDSSVTIKDIESNAGINIQNNSKATLDNVVAQNFYKYYAVYAGDNSEVTILSGYFDGGSKNKDLYGGITVYGGSFEHDPSAFVAYTYRVELVGGRYIVEAIPTYTLTFVTNDGTDVNQQNAVGVLEGEIFDLTKIITTREGYTFTGWYLNEDLTNKVDSVQVVKDTTVYAGWERNQLTVTFDPMGGSVYPETASVLYGGTLSSLPTPTRSGWYSFDGWYTAPNGGTRVTTSTVFYGDTTIYAHWDYIYIPMPNYYTLTFDVKGGTDISSVRRVSGTKIDLTDYVTTREGYTFNGWYSDAGLTDEITSVKLTKNTTVYAGWTEIVETPDPLVNPFTDVFETDWFYDDALYVYYNDLMYGTDSVAGTFSPALTTTRGMIVTILYRMEGEPSTDGLDNPFTDLAQYWYVDAVKWAAANGIVEGYGDSKYGPEDPITREQMATILWRYAKYKGIDVSSGNGMNIEGFADDEQISSYAVDAMKWVIAEGIIGGRPGGVLDPTGNAQRCEVAAIIHRFCELIEN